MTSHGKAVIKPIAEAAPEPSAELRQQVVSLLRDTGHIHRQLFRRRIRDIALAPGEGRVLLYLGGKQGCTQAQLAELLDIQPITLTRQIDRLEQAGYVLRSASPDDRRVRLLHLTPEGKTIARQVLKLAAALNDEITAELSESTLTQLAVGLESMRAVLTRMR